MSTDTPRKTPVWMPNDDADTSQPQCQLCEQQVTKQFVRVFGNNDNEVYGCLECKTGTAIKRGGCIQGREGDIDDGLPGGGVHGNR